MHSNCSPHPARSPDFRPLPFLGNPHVQTVLGNFWRGPRLELASRLCTVPLPDGDALALHDSVPLRWRPGHSVAVLVHGLGGSHRSGYMKRLARRLCERGVRVFRMDLRGAGAGARLTRRLYHAGCSGDLRAALTAVQAWTPGSPILLLGLSLGGNIALKLAGEAAGDPVSGLTRIAAIAPPIDMVRCAEMIALPGNRRYERFFVQALIRQVRRQERFFPALPRSIFPRALTLRGFDDIFTAPRNGFADALDYYCRSAALPVVEKIRVPTLILTARDDPFIAVEAVESVDAPATMEIHVAQRGGHLGFLGWDGAGGIRWAERRVVDWLLGAPMLGAPMLGDNHRLHSAPPAEIMGGNIAT